MHPVPFNQGYTLPADLAITPEGVTESSTSADALLPLHKTGQCVNSPWEAGDVRWSTNSLNSPRYTRTSLPVDIDLVDSQCYCGACEPGYSPISVNQANMTLSLPAPSMQHVLTTGWPFSASQEPTMDQHTQECFRIYDMVRATGVPNFLLARQPLPHGLNIDKWRFYLQGHTDSSLVDFLQYGFPVGFNPDCPLTPTLSNHASATNNLQHVEHYLTTEIEAGAILGPFSTPPFWPWTHLSPLMTREKKASVHRRVIVDLSWPQGASVNGGTPLETYLNEPYKLHLPAAEDLAVIISHFGPACGLWSRDLRRAYRQWRVCSWLLSKAARRGGTLTS
jgi:hypothetical protein